MPDQKGRGDRSGTGLGDAPKAICVNRIVKLGANECHAGLGRRDSG